MSSEGRHRLFLFRRLNPAEWARPGPTVSGSTGCEDCQQRVSVRIEPDMPRALLLENIDPVAVDLLSSAGYEVESLRGALDEADLAAALDGVTCSGIRSKTQVTADVLARRPELVAVGAFCIGTNQIDLARPPARRRGVQRAVLEHPQRRGAGDRGDHQPGPAADRPGPRAARRHLGQVGGRQPRDPRADARHRRLRQHRQPAVGAGRGPGHAGAVLRPGGQARPGQRRGAAAAWTSCSSARRP